MKNKIIKIFIMIFFMISIVEAANNEKNEYFCLVNLTLREKPSINSKSITVLKAGTIVNVTGKNKNKEKIDNLEGYWFKTKINTKEGWLYGGYLIKHRNQNIEEFIKRFEFFRYLGNCQHWSRTIKGVRCEIHIWYSGDTTEDLDKNKLTITFNIWPDYYCIFSENFRIKTINKVNNGYSLIAAGESDKGKLIKKGKYVSEGDFIAMIGIKDENLYFLDIKEMKAEEDGKTFNSLLLKEDFFYSQCFEDNSVKHFIQKKENK